jgi:hypothetical protein
MMNIVKSSKHILAQKWLAKKVPGGRFQESIQMQGARNPEE